MKNIQAYSEEGWDSLAFEDEIDCRDLFGGNDRREKILVFKIGEGRGGED